MTNEEAIELLKNMHWSITTKMNGEVPSSLALLMAIKALEKAPTALDHIHNVVAENAYDMPSFWCNGRKDYKVIPTKYHQGYMKALEDVEKDVRKWFGFAERENVIDTPIWQMWDSE